MKFKKRNKWHPWTQEEFGKAINKLFNGKISLIGKIDGMNNPVKVHCNVCGNEWFPDAKHLLEGRGCAQCAIKRNSMDPLEYAKRFKNILGDDFVQLTPYKRCHEKIKVKSLSCGHIFEIGPYDIILRKRCPKCFGKFRKTTKQFAKEVFNATNGEYKLMSDYKNNKTDVIMLHKLCNHTYTVRPHDFLHGNRCPYCKMPKGETTISHYLDSHKIKYEIQKNYSECGSPHAWYPFDFYVPSINTLIEFDGEQHFKSIEYFGGSSKLKDQQRRDKIKNEFAIKHNIHLIRIPYTCRYNGIDPVLNSLFYGDINSKYVIN